MEDARSENVVFDAWSDLLKRGTKAHKLLRWLKVTTKEHSKWNWNVFGFANQRINEFENSLEQLNERNAGDKGS